MAPYRRKEKHDIPEIDDIMVNIIQESNEAVEMWDYMKEFSPGGYTKTLAVKIRKRFDKISALKKDLRKEMLLFEKKISRKK